MMRQFIALNLFAGCGGYEHLFIRKRIRRFVEQSLFPEYIPEKVYQGKVLKKPKEEASEHRRRISRTDNLDFLSDLRTKSGYNKILLKAASDIVPTRLIAFSKAARVKIKDAIVHFYEYDYVLYRFWRNPGKYLSMLKRFRAVIGPDFTIECSMPDEVNEWHLYMNKVLSYIMQRFGITLIPNLSICPVKFYDKFFESLEPGGIYAVSTQRACGDYFSRHELFKFMREVVSRLHPKAVIVYGERVSFSGVRTYFFSNENIDKHNKKS